MRFMHLGDLHLGRSIGDFDLIEDQKYILDQILGIIDKESVDALLIAGDVYDKRKSRFRRQTELRKHAVREQQHIYIGHLRRAA